LRVGRIANPTYFGCGLPRYEIAKRLEIKLKGETMNRHDVRLLQQIRGYPCLTILLPTHRTPPNNRQDPVRLKNLVGEAADRLLSEFSKREVEALLKRLEELAGTIDFTRALDGLALFVNQDFARASILPFTVKERVVIDETFATRHLVKALNRSMRYWILVLSEKPTRLYEGMNGILEEIQENGFPMAHEGPGGEAPLPGGFGIKKSAYRDEYFQKFLRSVDAALKTVLAGDDLPVILTGVDRHLAFFNELTGHKASIIGTVTGSHDKTSPHELSKLAAPLIEKYLADKRREALEQLDKAIGAKKSASTIGDVWALAHEGRAELLLVEEGFRYAARLHADGKTLLPADDPSAPGAIDDAVDEIIEEVLNKQGKVIFVETGKLSEHGRIAVVLRY
jgi:hypothetical protein